MKAQPTTLYDVVTRCVMVDFEGEIDFLGPFPDRPAAMRAAHELIERKTQKQKKPDGSLPTEESS